MRTIAVVTVARSDFGIYRKVRISQQTCYPRKSRLTHASPAQPEGAPSLSHGLLRAGGWPKARPQHRERRSRSVRHDVTPVRNRS